MKYAGRIYKISSPSTYKVYIGSTKLSLKDRMNQHKKTNNNCTSSEILKYSDAKIQLVEDVYTDDDDSNFELLMRERHYIIKERYSVNKNLPIRYSRSEIEKRKKCKQNAMSDPKVRELYEIEERINKKLRIEREKLVKDREELYSPEHSLINRT